jgi:uncharacterized protein YndB with AHSA1/START domain
LIESLRYSVEVACPPDHAFRTWTERASAWWPRAHTLSGADVAEVVFEPRRGGRIYERTVGGDEFDWGEVLSWEPPARVSYSWHIATDRAHATEVEIVFVPLGPAKTRVDIEHRGWERLGDEEGGSWRTVNRGGWDGVLPDYVLACAGGVPGQ